MPGARRYGAAFKIALVECDAGRERVSAGHSELDHSPIHGCFDRTDDAPAAGRPDILRPHAVQVCRAMIGGDDEFMKRVINLQVVHRHGNTGWRAYARADLLPRCGRLAPGRYAQHWRILGRANAHRHADGTHADSDQIIAGRLRRVDQETQPGIRHRL